MHVLMTRIIPPLLLLAAQAAAAATETAPPTAAVASVAVAGTGCAAAAGQAAFAEANRLLLLTLPDVNVKNTPRRDARHACNVIVALTHTAKWQLKVVDVTVSVEGKLAPTAVGELSYASHYQGAAANAAASATWRGDVARRDETIPLNSDWSPCGNQVTLVQRLALKLSGDLANTSQLGALGGIRVRLAWRTCT